MNNSGNFNQSGIHPRGDRILVMPLEIEHKTASGIILHSMGQKDREDMANTTGEVVEIGSTAVTHENMEGVKCGDRIVFAKFSGLLYVGKDGKKYRVINTDNVVALLDGDVKLVDPHLKKGIEQ